MTIDRGKYVTFKTVDLERMLYQDYDFNEADLAYARAKALEDAVVIRKKDVFAASALYSYATAVQSAIELLGEAQTGVVVDRSVLEHLSELADYFAGEADHARQLHGRIPC